MRTAAVYYKDILAGRLDETGEGYLFTYDAAYLGTDAAQPVSLTLPLSYKPYHSAQLFPFFDGLIPEGWLLNIASQTWNIKEYDRMGLLLACCRDCIGAVHILPVEAAE